MHIMQFVCLLEVLGKGSFGKAYLVKNTEAVLPDTQSSLFLNLLFLNLESFLSKIMSRGLWHSYAFVDMLKCEGFPLL